MGKHEAKEQQRISVERLLESDLSVSEWCHLYKVNKQTMYSWLNRFADEEPELFGGVQNIFDRTRRRWVENTRANIKASKALALRQSPGVVIVDTLAKEDFPAPPGFSNTRAKGSASAISVALKGAHITIPQGANISDVSCVLKAVSEL